MPRVIRTTITNQNHAVQVDNEATNSAFIDEYHQSVFEIESEDDEADDESSDPFVEQVASTLNLSPISASRLVTDWNVLFSERHLHAAATAEADRTASARTPTSDSEEAVLGRRPGPAPIRPTSSRSSADRAAWHEAMEAQSRERNDERHPETSTRFPNHNMENWERRKRESAVDDFFRQVDYRLRWIFLREEREGFSRNGRYGVVPFSPEDFNRKATVHSMNTKTNTFYDWDFGATDFIMRMEAYTFENVPHLRCHFIHKPTGKQIAYQDRVWDGSKFHEVDMKWAECE